MSFIVFITTSASGTTSPSTQPPPTTGAPTTSTGTTAQTTTPEVCANENVMEDENYVAQRQISALPQEAVKPSDTQVYLWISLNLLIVYDGINLKRYLENYLIALFISTVQHNSNETISHEF